MSRIHTTPRSPRNPLPLGCRPGRGKKHVHTPWGARNAAFINARKAMRAGKREEAEVFLAVMNQIQTVTARERRAVERAAR